MSKETYSYGKRDLFIWKKRHIAQLVPECSGMRKCQKRPIHMAKEAYSYGKRGLFIWQKRPTNIGIPHIVRGAYAEVSKETYSYSKEAY